MFAVAQSNARTEAMGFHSRIRRRINLPWAEVLALAREATGTLGQANHADTLIQI